MPGYPQVSFWISITLVKFCFSCVFSKPGKNTFELVGTVLNTCRRYFRYDDIYENLCQVIKSHVKAILKLWLGNFIKLIYNWNLNTFCRNHRKQRDSRELNGKQYAVANSNDSGIGDKESLDRVPGVKYMQGVRQGSEGSESWV